MSTFMQKKETVVRKWYILDAAGKPLCSNRGIYSVTYTYDEEGNATREEHTEP